MVSVLVLLSYVVYVVCLSLASTSASYCVGRLVSRITYNVLVGTLNSTHSLNLASMFALAFLLRENATVAMVFV